MTTEPAVQMIQIEKPAPPAIVRELSPLVLEARAFQVVDVETNGIALQRLKVLREGEKRIADYFEPARKAADAAKKEILAARDGLIAPIAAARGLYDNKAADYEAEERRKAEEEQRRLQERARKEEEERQILAAIEAEDRGEKAESEAILQETVSMPVIHVAPAVAKVQGVSSRTTWEPEIHSARKALRFLVEHDEWEASLERFIPLLITIFRPLAIAQREALAIPGVRAISKSVRSSR